MDAQQQEKAHAVRLFLGIQSNALIVIVLEA